jgi:hypothetical protein
MFDTADSAGFWFDIFNGVLLLGAFLVLVGTWGTIKTSAIKERFADERTVANEAETKRAIADSDAAKEATAKADQRNAELTTQAEQLRKHTADANARAAEAKLELEKFRAPRTLSPEQSARLTKALRPFSGVKFDGAWSSLEGEIDFFFTSLEDALKQAGWESISFNGPGLIYGCAGRSSVGMANAAGIVIAVNFETNPELTSAALALLKILSEEGVSPVLQQNVGLVSTNPNTIHILIGSKH